MHSLRGVFSLSHHGYIFRIPFSIGESYSFYSPQRTTESDSREKMRRPPEDPKTLRLDLL